MHNPVFLRIVPPPEADMVVESISKEDTEFFRWWNTMCVHALARIPFKVTSSFKESLVKFGWGVNHIETGFITFHNFTNLLTSP